MKKLLISLSAIVMLVASATVASAAGGYIVDYVEDASSDTLAVVDVYLDVENDGTGFAALACQLGLYDGVNNVMKDYVSSATCTPYGNLSATNVKYNSSQGLMMITGSGTSTTALMYDDATRQLARFELALSKPLVDGLVFSKLATRDTSYTPFVAGVKQSLVVTSALDEYATVTITSAGPALEEAEEVKAFTEEGSAPATAFKVTTNAVEGKSAYWTATIGGTPMITKNPIPNVSGEVTLGLVFHGTQTISNVNLLWK